MFSDNKKISKRQVFRLLTYDMLGLGTLLVPPVLAKVSGEDGIFCIAIALLFAFLFLRGIKALLQGMETDYISYLQVQTGKIGSSLLLIGYLAYFVTLAGYAAYHFTNLVMRNLLKEESFFLILLLLLLLVCYGIWEGVESRARVYEILFWAVMLPLFFMLMAACDEVQVDYWTPVFSTDISAVVYGSYYAFWPLSLVFLVLFVRKHVEKKEAAMLAGWNALRFAGAVYAVLYLILLGIFGVNALGTMEYPAVTLMSTVKTFGGFLKRMDAFMFAIWFFTLYALLSSMVFYGAEVLRGLSRMTRINEEQNKVQKKERISAAFLLVATFFVACLFYRSKSACREFEKMLLLVGTPFVVGVPMLLLLFSKGKKTKSRQIVGVLALALTASVTLSGCSTAELEERNYPIEIGVKDTDSFAAQWLNTEKTGNRVVDYNHLKVLIIDIDFLTDEKEMETFLNLLEKETDVPRNTYVVAAEEPEKIMGLTGDKDESVGNYLEQLFENVSRVKKKMYPTLGMLYQEKENRRETLWIPCVSEKEEKPVIEEFLAWNKGAAAGIVSKDVAMLSFFTQNGMDAYTLILEDCAVELSASSNALKFAAGEEIKVEVIVKCEGRILYPENQKPERIKEEIESYMNKMAADVLKKGIDVTNSYRKLGGAKRESFFELKKNPLAYEENMEIVYETDISWVNE